MGLTPIMIWRPAIFQLPLDGNIPEQHHCPFGLWRWIQDMKFLDQLQEDRLDLGLSTCSGWHYMAATAGFTYMDPFYMGSKAVSPEEDHKTTPFLYKMIGDLSQSLSRDRCVCWCTPQSQGCSPLKSLWIAHADCREAQSWLLRHGAYFRVRRDMIWRHCLFHHRSEHPNQTRSGPLSTMSIELVRLVTFESLDMTHTCCYLEQLTNLQDNQPMSPAERKALSLEEDYPSYLPHVIAACSPEVTEEIRSDPLEQQNAQLLDELMNEFEPQILNLDFSDPKALEGFILGPWRRRISELFAVNPQVVAEMERVVDNVSVGCKSGTNLQANTLLLSVLITNAFTNPNQR
jgi:hypothetical protein